jgi:uncharacterized membrane protein YraQ (UPF0718 family)
MRLPPDLVAVVIKTKDFLLVFGPALLLALTSSTFVKTLLFARLSPAKYLWLRRTLCELLNRSPKADKFTEGKQQVAKTHSILARASFVTAAPGSLIAALTLNPFLFGIRLLSGCCMAVIAFIAVRFFGKSTTPIVATQDAMFQVEDNAAPFDSKLQPLEYFKKDWLRSLDQFFLPAVYNFLVAALFTIFIPIPLIRGWQTNNNGWLILLVIPLLGLFLMSATGSETALVLALSFKGISGGAVVIALLAFPLLNLSNITSFARTYGVRTTFTFVLSTWFTVYVIGFFIDQLEVNIYV